MENLPDAKLEQRPGRSSPKGLSYVPYSPKSLRAPEQRNPRVFKSGGVVRLAWDMRSKVGGGGTRGKIVGYSEDSARRFKEIAERLKFGDSRRNVFATLTYHENQQNFKASKVHLSRFIKRMTYYGLGSLVWFCEQQKRGAIHYHLIGVGWLRGRCITELRKIITKAWVESSEQDHDEDAWKASCQCDKLRKEDGAKRYLAKYLSKPSQKSLATEEWCGRWWGVRQMELEEWEEVKGGDASKMLALACDLQDRYGYLPRVMYPTIARYVVKTVPKRYAMEFPNYHLLS